MRSLVLIGDFYYWLKTDFIISSSKYTKKSLLTWPEKSGYGLDESPRLHW